MSARAAGRAAGASAPRAIPPRAARHAVPSASVRAGVPPRGVRRLIGRWGGIRPALILLALAGCGADAPPVPPGPPLDGPGAEPRVTITGQASVGVGGRRL